MKIPFYKYQGTGNDFIMIDNRQGYIAKPENSIIARWCNRKFGIGADGLMLLQAHPDYDFEMVYFNADGNLGSMCGNGGRCITAFANYLGAIADRAHFLAVDGPHEALIREDAWVELKMLEVSQVEKNSDHYYLDTGSPHYVQFVADLKQVDIFQRGRKVRYNERFQEKGTNVNFVQALTADSIEVATYERGVEAETLSCGTGVTAAAIAYSIDEQDEKMNLVNIKAKGGSLQVRFEQQDGNYSEIWLCGPAEQVFSGSMDWK